MLRPWAQMQNVKFTSIFRMGPSHERLTKVVFVTRAATNTSGNQKRTGLGVKPDEKFHSNNLDLSMTFC